METENNVKQEHATKRKTMLFIICIILFGLWLRVDGLDWGMPFRLHPDEWKYVSGAARCHEGQWNPNYYRNPPGYTYLNAAWYPLWLQIRKPVDVPDWLGIDPILLQPTNHVIGTFQYRPFDLVIGSRVLAALAGALTALIVFLLTRETFNNQTGLIAALFYSCSFANVRESHFAVNDTTMILFLMMTLWLGLRAYQRTSLKVMLIAAVTAGISVGMKYSAVPVVVILIMLWIAVHYTQHRINKILILLGQCTAIGLISMLVFFMICPFPITDPSSFWPDFWEQYHRANIYAPGQEEGIFAIAAVKSFFLSEGFLITILSAVGLFLLAKQKRWEILIFPIFFFLVLSKHKMFFVRYCLPIMPWLSIWAAYTLVRISKRIPWNQNVLISLLTIGCIAEPLIKDVRSNWLIKQTDTRIECLKWFVTEGRTNGLTAVGQYAVPIRYKGVADVLSYPFSGLVWIDNLASNEFERLNQLPPPALKYVALSSFATFTGGFKDTYFERRNVVQDFTGSNQPLLVFQPWLDKRNPAPAHLEDTYTPVTDLWQRNQPGPFIEIFEMK